MWQLLLLVALAFGSTSSSNLPPCNDTDIKGVFTSGSNSIEIDGTGYVSGSPGLIYVDCLKIQYKPGITANTFGTGTGACGVLVINLTQNNFPSCTPTNALYPYIKIIILTVLEQYEYNFDVEYDAYIYLGGQIYYDSALIDLIGMNFSQQ